MHADFVVFPDRHCLDSLANKKNTTGSIVSPSTTIRSVWMVMIWGTVW